MTTDNVNVKRVVGLQYSPQEGPPTVVLQSIGATAEAVLRAGQLQKQAVPIVKNEELLEQLYRLPIDAPIDPALYELVAILLVHVFAVDEAVATRR